MTDSQNRFNRFEYCEEKGKILAKQFSATHTNETYNKRINEFIWMLIENNVHLDDEYYYPPKRIAKIIQCLVAIESCSFPFYYVFFLSMILKDSGSIPALDHFTKMILSMDGIYTEIRYNWNDIYHCT